MSDECSLPVALKLAAIVDDEAIAAAADAIPVHSSRDGGRPRHYGPYVHLLVHVFAKSVYGGSVRRTMTELGHLREWRYVAELVRRKYPDRPELWLPPKPMGRYHYLAFRNRYIATRAGTVMFSTVLLETGCRLALELGLFQRRGSLTHPDPSDCLGADGKTIRAITRFRPGEQRVDPETGEILGERRADPDVREHRVGGKNQPVRGHRFVIGSARDEDWMQRAILFVADSASGSELDALLPLLPALNDRLNIAALLYDGAIHGVHIDELLRQYGILCLSPVTSKRTDRDDHRKRVEREVPLPAVDAQLPGGGGTRQPDLWAVGGAACEANLNERGERVYTRLKLVKLERRGRPGTHRLYGTYTCMDGATLRLELYTTTADKERKFNRSEHLRPFPAGSDDYKRVYPRRSDTESLNRQLEDQLWQKRANCYGRLRVHADLLGFALGQNAIARFIHGARSSNAPPGELAA